MLLSSKAPNVHSYISIGLAILLVLSVVYLILRNGDLIINALGVKGMRVNQRLMGLILMVIAVQFGINGVSTVLQPLLA